MKPSILFIAILMAAGSAPAQAPAGKPPVRVVPTVTRTIQLFSTLENEWLDAVQQRDQAALKKIVAPDFEQRNAAAPGVPTPREESISHALKLAPFHSSIGQMAAHEYGDLMVVSFLWKLDVRNDAALAQKVFVVDTWKRGEAGWQVVTRYTAPVADAPRHVPGVAPETPAVEKKI